MKPAPRLNYASLLHLYCTSAASLLYVCRMTNSTLDGANDNALTIRTTAFTDRPARLVVGGNTLRAGGGLIDVNVASTALRLR